MKQKTAARVVELEGRGLHTGEQARLRVLPAAQGQGVLFKRVDLDPGMALSVEDVVAESGYGRTSIARGEVRIDTVEHLMAALHGVGVTNATVEIEGPEIPAFDGSALVAAKALIEAGIEEQGAEQVDLVPFAPVFASGGGAHLSFLPGGDGLTIRFATEYSSSGLASAHGEFPMDPKTFLEEIAPARTFCMKEDVDRLRSSGIGKGATTENTLVIDGDRVEGNVLRFPDEPLRHKILDLLGDLSLTGARLCGKAIGVRSGHALNRVLVAKLKACRPGQIGGIHMGIAEIERILPHRYPFLLIDRVVEFEEGKRVVALKNVTRNEEFFQGHFPGNPVMPGVLQIEALAQAAGILLAKYFKDSERTTALVGLDQVRFRRPVSPGDALILSIEAERLNPKRNLGIVRGKATVGGELAAEARLLFALMKEGQ